MLKRKIAFILLALAMLASCAYDIGQTPMTPKRMYVEAQNTYLSAWNSYQKAWMILPENDLRKRQWVKDYHPIFIAAGESLLLWSKTPEYYNSDADKAIALAEDICLKLAIAYSKGGK
jgi:hypothetical protein